jgi:hypothetical protein
VRVEDAVDQEPRVVVDDQEQLGPHRVLGPWIRHPRPDQHVGHPPLVRPLGLVAAEDPVLGRERCTMEPPPAQLIAHRALGDTDAVVVVDHAGDLGCRATGLFQTEPADLVYELGVPSHRPDVGARVGLQGVEAAVSPRADPAVDRAARVPPLGPVGVCVDAACDLADDAAALGFGEPDAHGLCDNPVAVERDAFFHVVVHAGISSSRALFRAQEP